MIEKEKPSERIRFAVDALQEVIDGKVPLVKPMMRLYHGFIDKDNPDVCYACLGGISAIKRYNLDLKILKEHVENHDRCECFTTSLNKFDSTLGSYERSLDCARRGDIGSMFNEMGLKYLDGYVFDQEEVYFSESNPEYFIDKMLDLAQTLQNAGY